jgi:sodium-dependent dicarboxylate transporter 2/3/5
MFSGFLSMWISNTATTAMMLPIVDAISQVLSEQSDEEKSLEDSEMKELTNSHHVKRKTITEVKTNSRRLVR